MTLHAFTVGVAVLLDAAGVAVWDPARVWTKSDTQVAINMRSVTQDPPKLVAITAYTTTADDPVNNDSTIAFQLYTRGDENPQTAQDIDDAAFNMLHGLHDLTVGGVAVGQIRRVSSLAGPQDENHRWTCSSNYYATVAWPTANRTD